MPGSRRDLLISVIICAPLYSINITFHCHSLSLHTIRRAIEFVDIKQLKLLPFLSILRAHTAPQSLMWAPMGI